MRTIHRDIVSATIFSKDGKLFQARKNQSGGGVYIDCWHIPGGGIDEGEDKLSAIVREIKEETSLDISSYSLELIDDLGTGTSEKTLKDTGEHVLCEMKFYIYKVTLDTTAAETPITLSEELEEYRWTDLSELKDLKLTPPSVNLFDRLGWIE